MLRVDRDLIDYVRGSWFVPTMRLRARHTRADGTPVLRIEVPFEFDLDEAARALAIVYAEEPLHQRVHALRDGLARAAEQRVLHRAGSVADQAVAAYRARLREIKVFPDEPTRAQMLKRLRRAQAKHRKSDPASRPTAPLVRQPAIWAKHERESDGHPVVRIEVPRYFDLDQAADALARVYAGKPEPLRSANAMRLGLQQAARSAIGSRKPAAVRGDLVDRYRRILIEEGVFPE
jgi:hypothetical protein